MGPCCVDGCEVTSEETFYFEFPTSRILRRKWLELIPMPGKLPLGTVVCSRHFQAHEYESVRGKVRLKRKVVPSLLLHQKLKSPTAPRPKSPTAPRPKSPTSPRPKSPSPTKDATTPPKSPTPTKSPPSPKSPTSPKSPASPKSPLTLTIPVEACDSTTVSVPSPMDAEKMIDDIQRIAGTVSKLVRTQNGVSGDGDRIGVSDDGDRIAVSVDGNKKAVKSPPLQAIPPLDQKEDIEDMITNYHIKNKVPNPALLADLEPPPLEGLLGHQTLPVEYDPGDLIEIDDVKEADPVFIEVSVDKDAGTAGAGSQDCLMLLESVQVDVDPSTLLLHDLDYYQDEESRGHKKDDPISLLTSSDEDDVILQEPHIDTVEISDETDEDDMPLVKLVKKPQQKKKLQKKKTKHKKQEKVDEIMWGVYDFYCVQCHFSTKSISEYDKHVSEHSTVLLVCPICSYTSASKSMFTRHTRIHKVEKKFKCHLCDYKARHKMSLIYHLKNHKSDSKSDKFKCKRCDFKSDKKRDVLEHLSSCTSNSEKKHKCLKCDYATKKKSDLKRHTIARH